MLDNIWDSHMITINNNIAPGPNWGGDTFLNPSYFAPAWYKIFKLVDKSNHNWDLVIDNCYNSINKNPGYALGLIPDWMTPEGNYFEGNLGYNTYGNGKYLFKDAIRIFWRIGTDYLWFNESRAKTFLENAYSFIESKNGPAGCNFYQMTGELVPENDKWDFANNNRQRPRREHSHLTIGMWSIVPYVLNKSNINDYKDELLKFYNGNTYWGLLTGPETIYNNEMYFDQFLALFGAIVLNGLWAYN